MWSDEEILAMVKCPKKIIQRPKREFEYENRQYRNNARVQSEDEKYIFTVFMRYLSDMPEDFSVGLKLESPNVFCTKPIILFRCQGPHGGFVENQVNDDPHNGYHTHTLRADDVNKRIFEPKGKSIVKSYASLEQAILYFAEYCNIRDGRILLGNKMQENSIQQLSFFKE